MRKILVAMIALILAMAACTSSAEDVTTTSIPETSTSAPEEPTSTTTTVPVDGRGGIVTIGVATEPSTLNPFSPTLTGTDRLVGNAIWATVYDIDPATWDYVPDIVTALPSASGAIEVDDDGTMTVTYEVRAGAVWSDGTPVSGADIAFTAEAMRDLALAGLLGQSSAMAGVVEVDSVDRLAFITFSEPGLGFERELRVLAPAHHFAVASSVAEGDGSDWPTAGPFLLDAFEAGQSVRFVRNTQYWADGDDGRPLPYLDGLQVRLVPFDEQPSLDVALRNGDFDVVDVPPGDDLIARLREVEGVDIQAGPSAVLEQLTLQFDRSRLEVNESSRNDDVRLRRLLAGVIDREALVEATGVPWIPAYGLADPFGDAWADPEVDIDELVATLTGSEGEPPMVVLTTTGNGDYRVRIGDALETQLAEHGIDYRVEYQDSVLFFGDTLGQGIFDVGLWAWGFSDHSLLDLYDPSQTPPEGNYGNWPLEGEAAEEYADLVQRSHVSTSRSELEDLVARADEILSAEVPTIPLFFRAVFAAHRINGVSGIEVNGSISELTWNVETWRKPGE